MLALPAVDLDLNPMLVRVDEGDVVKYKRDRERNPVPDTLDAQIVADAGPFLNDGEKMQLDYTVQNTHRTIGTRVSSARRTTPPRPNRWSR